MSLFRRRENSRLVVRKLFAEHSNPDQAALLWTRSVADSNELNPATDQLRLIRELRKEDSSLNLEVATFLAEEAAKAS